MHSPEELNTAQAAVYLTPYMRGRNPTHFLADNRAGRTSVPLIPYKKIGRKAFYRVRQLDEFIRTLAGHPGIVFSATSPHPVPVPSIRTTKGASPSIEIRRHSRPIAVIREKVIELVRALVAAIK